MNNLRWVIIVILWVVQQTSFAQDIAINNIVATDISASDDDILELSFRDQLPNLPFLLAWVTESGQQYAIQLRTQKEDLFLNLSEQQGWEGRIQMLGLSIENVGANLRHTQFSDHIRHFLRPNVLTPGTVNFSGPYLFKGIALRWVTLGLFVLLSIILTIVFRNWRLGLLISFVVAWLTYDIRGMKNKWDIMNDLKKEEYQINIFTDLDQFVSESRAIIGEQSWSKEPLSGVLNSYCTYHLADLKYIPPQRAAEADVIITNNPGRRRVLLNRGAYFLVSQN